MKKVKHLFFVLTVTATMTAFAQSKGEMPFSASSEINKSLRNSWIALADFNIDEANSNTRNILREDPGLGMAYVSLFSESVEERKENLRKAESSKLSEDEKMFVEGLKAHLAKQSPQAYFEPLIKKYPRDFYLQLWMMFNYDNPKRSIEIGEALIKRGAKFAPAYNLLGYLYMSQNDMAKAEAYFDKYIALRPDLANVYDSKGDFMMRAGRTEEAIQLYHKAFSLGMADSKIKAEEATAKLKYPALSETDEAVIKTMLSGSIEAYDQSDVDVLLKDYSQQAIKIWGNQVVSVGIANLRENFVGTFKYTPYTRFDGSIQFIDGVGAIAVAYGKSESIQKNTASGQETKRVEDFIYLLRKREGEDWKILADHFYGEEESSPLSEEDRKSIQALLSNWDRAHAVGGAMTEEHLPAYAALHSPQIIEIYPNQVTNIGTGNLLARLQFAIGVQFKKSSLNPIAIEGLGRRAVAWGIASQILYRKESDKPISRQYPWAMLLTKEKDDVWRVLVIHWAP